MCPHIIYTIGHHIFREGTPSPILVSQPLSTSNLVDKHSGNSLPTDNTYIIFETFFIDRDSSASTESYSSGKLKHLYFKPVS